MPLWLSSPLKRIRARVTDIHASKSYSQEGEDMILKRIFEGKEHGFYVDIGAHHPRRFSNTHFFYCKGWSGINIEPNPEGVAAFQRERSRDINLQLAVSDHEGELTYYLFDDPALNSFNKELTDQRLRTSHYKLIGTKAIPVQRLEVLLRKHLPSGTKIDFLTVDVEGLDMCVLRSNDWKTFRPAWVLIESLGSTVEMAIASEETAFMREQEYELYAKTVNTLIFRCTGPKVVN